MRRLGQWLVVIVVNLLGLGSAAPAAAGVSIQIGLGFHDSLAPHGDWLHNDRYGEVWAPRHLDHGWRPYTRGRWAYTDDDWTWVSDDEWGWATDHYGRWYFDERDGWVWVPGEEWAPAWVAWRHGGGYVGWAPLPPEYDAFEGGADLRIDPFAYSFLEERRMMDRGAYRYFVPSARNGTYLNLTLNVTRYGRVNDRIVNRGIDVQSVERFTGRAVPRAHIRDAASAAQAHAGRAQRGDVAFFRPRAAPGGPPPGGGGQVRPVGRGNAERPDQLARRQEQERQRLEANESRERGRLRQIQERENKHPPAVRAAPPEAPAAPARPTSRPAPIDTDELRGRHDAERKAQAEHEQREQQELQRRHQRETSSVAEAPPRAEPRRTKAEKPKAPPRDQGKGKDKGKDKRDKD
jgi:hypothetical protein